MRKPTTLCLIAFTLCYSAFLFADGNENTAIPATTSNTAITNPVPNEVIVGVLDRSSTALQLSLQSAFSQVLINMSGNPNIASSPAIHVAAGNVAQWVQTYGYIEKPNPNPQLPPVLAVRVVFDKAGIESLLHMAVHAASAQQATGQQTTVSMMVEGVKTISDYVDLMKTLREKNDVTEVTADNVQGDRVVLAIKLNSNPLQFQQLLSTDNHFRSLTSATAQSSALNYYWMGNQA